MFDKFKCPYSPCGYGQNCIGCKYDPNKRDMKQEDVKDSVYGLRCYSCVNRGSCNMRGCDGVSETDIICVNYSPNENISPWVYNHWKEDVFRAAIVELANESKRDVCITLSDEPNTTYLVPESIVVKFRLTKELVLDNYKSKTSYDDDGKPIVERAVRD